MVEIFKFIETIAILAAIWKAFYEVGAWKHEFLGKRKIELAEEVLGSFFEVQDAIEAIRNPMYGNTEGTSRKKEEIETTSESKLLNRAYVIIERYSSHKEIFTRFKKLQYRFKASFGSDTEKLFIDTLNVINSIFASANVLATYYWQRQGNTQMTEEERQIHLTDMHKYESILWAGFNDEDPIRNKLSEIQTELERITKPCFGKSRK